MDLLDCVVQNYAWGDSGFLAKLQRREPSGLPEAELWIGAHRSAPSQLVDDGRALDGVIEGDPVRALGAQVAEAFGELPFLTKILCAAEPLSIQTHPSRTQAQAGFSRENDAGLALDSPVRSYRDANHKPELICALTPFEAKCGFRPLDETRELFSALADSGLDEIRARLREVGPEADVVAGLVGWLLRLDDGRATEVVAATARAASSVSAPPEHAAALGWVEELALSYPGDVGVTVSLLLNHVVLAPGEALFLEAGVLHSYLRGSAVEIMASSDNVVRAGLTPKHVDVEELMNIGVWAPGAPAVQAANGPVHTLDASVVDFSLTRLELDGEMTFEVAGPETLLVVEGQAEVTTLSRDLSVEPGQAVWVPASDRSYGLRGRGLVFRSAVAVSPL